MKGASACSTHDLAVDRAIADIADGFRFLLDLSPVNVTEAREEFRRRGVAPSFRYRPLEDDPEIIAKRLDDVPIESVEDPTIASLLLAKVRELRLQVDMLRCRGSAELLALSIELYGTVSPSLLEEATAILLRVDPQPRRAGPWLDAGTIAAAACAELDHYRSIAPEIESRIEIKEGSTGLMVSNGDLLVAPTARVSARRIDALLQHEIGVHVVTHVNGTHQPLRVLASGLAGHDETQEGLAVLAEHVVGGLTADRLRQLAARVVAVHQMVEGASFPDVHASLIGWGIPSGQAFTVVMRVFRAGGLTKDAVYLRGLRELLEHLASGHDLEVLWLGKMPLTAAPLVGDLHRRGVLVDPLLRPRFLGEPSAAARLAELTERRSLVQLIGDHA